MLRLLDHLYIPSACNSIWEAFNLIVFSVFWFFFYVWEMPSYAFYVWPGFLEKGERGKYATSNLA